MTYPPGPQGPYQQQPGGTPPPNAPFGQQGHPGGPPAQKKTSVILVAVTAAIVVVGAVVGLVIGLTNDDKSTAAAPNPAQPSGPGQAGSPGDSGGSSDSGDDAAQVRKLGEAAAAAFSSGDQEAARAIACDPSALTKPIKAIPDTAVGRDAKIEGDKATVYFSNPHETSEGKLTALKQGGKWCIVIKS
ncbi:hypothetical protein [Amycolatopsis sp. CA-230715]|uniref:hypothetical protein n=1 Tax=Amycolatopsis sp. CA-230715 TaxID=2745196 RepID=UPI001C00D038|nr:hypothetical protein [Amycolatopsis sp. CA-230715]